MLNFTGYKVQDSTYSMCTIEVVQEISIFPMSRFLWYLCKRFPLYPPETNITSQKLWLRDDPFLLGRWRLGLYSGANYMLVLGRATFSQKKNPQITNQTVQEAPK